MKISVITRHAVPNYGSILQSYATQVFFENLGYDVEFIDYLRRDEKGENLAKTLLKGKKWDKNILTRSVYLMLQYYNYKRQFDRFSEFRKNFINLSNKQYETQFELERDLPEADIYCTGSDQVWGPIGTDEYDSSYFLNFVKDKERKKIISLSSSFGFEKIGKKLNEKIKNELDKYDFITVRELTAKKLLESYGINNCTVTLDPTLLISKEQWELIANRNIKEKEYILVYQLHNSKEFEKYIKKVSKLLNKKIIRISPSLVYLFKFGKLKYLPDQYQFLSYIKNADLIITDSFHGTVFSMIFNKRFISISPGKTSSRIRDLLSFVELNDRMIEKFTDFEIIHKDIDYNAVNKKLAEKRLLDNNYIKDMLSNDANNIKSINLNKKCSGCRLCEKICPKEAITFSENGEGFYFPNIDLKKCINCGMCLKKCPQINLQQKNKVVGCYAAKTVEEKDLMKGSSGSIFITLAKEFIFSGGVVYASKYDKDLNVITNRIDNANELDEYTGSKYVQGNTLDTFKEAIVDLKSEKKVLYVGTPCQVAGMKRLAEIKGLTKNLFTVDIICHGVPSPKLFKKFLGNLEEKYNDKIVNYEFRCKEKNGWGMNSKITFESGKCVHNFNNNNSYFKSFLDGKTYRYSCYECKYAGTDRISDITLGDYWGVEREHSNFDSTNGVSCIIVNTEKGENLMNCIKSKINYIETSIDKISNENTQLKRPSKMPVERTNIYNEIDEISYNSFEKKILKFKTSYKEVMKSMIPLRIKKRLKKILKR